MTYFLHIFDYIFPLFILFAFFFALYKKVDVMKSFTSGFSDGVKTIFSIMPNIVCVMVASSLFRESGAFSVFASLLSPVFSFFKIPTGLYELIIMRPVSGSGSIAILTSVLETYGADSFEGILASVIASSTETTLYTVAVYFGVTNAKKNGIPIFVGLATDFFTTIFAIFIINLLF